MSKATTFIINPASGFGKTRKMLKSLVKEIRRQDSFAKILLTRHALHAIGLAKESLKDGVERLVVIGGDGTLNEVVNGYFDKDGKPHNENASIAIVPSGTGSDFVRSIDQKRSLSDSVEFALNGAARATDVGLVEAHDANGLIVKRYFINVSSLGLSGVVAGFMKSVTKKLGPKSAYFISTLQAIRAFRAPTLLISGGGVKKTLENCSLVSFANGRYYGSGMMIAPHAELDDGLLDVVTVQNLSAMFFLLNGYRVYQGTHLHLDNVHACRQSECVVKSLSKEPVYVETDGELFAQLPAKYSIRRNVLPMVR